MKKILYILLLLPCFLSAQETVTIRIPKAPVIDTTGLSNRINAKTDQPTFVSISSAYTAPVKDCIISCTANTFTVTLPTVVNSTTQYTVINLGAGVITITSPSTFNGAPSIVLNAGHVVQVQAAATQYIITSQY